MMNDNYKNKYHLNYLPNVSSKTLRYLVCFKTIPPTLQRKSTLVGIKVGNYIILSLGNSQNLDKILHQTTFLYSIGYFIFIVTFHILSSDFDYILNHS